MNEEAFSEEDAAHDLLDRFEARRVMINLMIQLEAPPVHTQFATPEGVNDSDKLRAFIEQGTANQLPDTPTLRQIDRPPGTGSISGLVEEAKQQFQNHDKDK